MEILLIIPMLALLVFIIYSAVKVKKIAGFYKEMQMFGRVYAFFTFLFLADSVFIAISSIIMFALNQIEILHLLLLLVIAVGCGVAGVFMYMRVYKKCPDELKKRLLLDIIIIGLGSVTRVYLFVFAIFIHTWYELNKPVQYTLYNGDVVYKYPDSNDVYDRHGYKVGRLSDDGGKVILD